MEPTAAAITKDTRAWGCLERPDDWLAEGTTSMLKCESGEKLNGTARLRIEAGMAQWGVGASGASPTYSQWDSQRGRQEIEKQCEVPMVL